MVEDSMRQYDDGFRREALNLIAAVVGNASEA